MSEATPTQTQSIPTPREAIVSICDNSTLPDYTAVTDVETAERVLAGLLEAPLRYLGFHQGIGFSEHIELAVAYAHFYSSDGTFIKYGPTAKFFGDAIWRHVDEDLDLCIAKDEAEQENNGVAPDSVIEPRYWALRFGVTVTADSDPLKPELAKLSTTDEHDIGITWTGPFDRATFETLAYSLAMVTARLEQAGVRDNRDDRDTVFAFLDIPFDVNEL